MKLFVYGTLKSDRVRRLLGVDRGLDKIEDATVIGTLYDFGMCPGLVLGGEERISGKLLTINKEVNLTLDRLDRYEGSCYKRVKCKAIVEDHPVNCYTYVVDEDLVKELNGVKTANWEI